MVWVPGPSARVPTRLSTSAWRSGPSRPLSTVGGRQEAAARAARFCRRFPWGQPDDVLGFLIGWEDQGPAEPLVEAHATDQRFGALGVGALFLARSFEETGDDEDLDAAIELHDV